MTNRLDMIDEAVIRPGRLELHLEIGLPDEFGRRQIFEIHTRDMRKHNLLAPCADLDELAAASKNYTGAEIEAVCRSAASFALFNEDDLKVLAESAPSGKKNKALFVERKVTMNDFKRAVEEVKPAFGIDDSKLENSIRGGFFQYGKPFLCKRGG